jgi:hypothetical protein
LTNSSDITKREWEVLYSLLLPRTCFVFSQFLFKILFLFILSQTTFWSLVFSLLKLVYLQWIKNIGSLHSFSLSLSENKKLSFLALHLLRAWVLKIQQVDQTWSTPLTGKSEVLCRSGNENDRKAHSGKSGYLKSRIPELDVDGLPGWREVFHSISDRCNPIQVVLSALDSLLDPQK